MARPKKLPKVLSKAEQASLLAQFNTRYDAGLRNLTMIRLMLETGLRAGEVVALRTDHINMLTCKMIVREGKGARDRVLWITESMRDLLATWYDRKPASEFVFPTRAGRQMDTSHLRHMLKRYVARADIQEPDKVSPHTLRHTFATELFRETCNIVLVQKALGHENIQTTMIYTHLVDDDLENAMKARGAA
jgi:integrase/recombinase XerD